MKAYELPYHHHDDDVLTLHYTCTYANLTTLHWS